MADLQKTSSEKTLMKRMSFVPENDTTGTDDITSDDVRLPRLAIAQGLSSQITPDSSDHIKGLSLFELFNDLTGTNYHRGPIKFVPIKRTVRRIEFDPDNRGVPVDMNVPFNDPRCDWTENEQTGEREAPRATKFTEFVIMLLEEGKKPEPIVLSIKDTNKWNRKAAERLTALIKIRPPIYSTYFTVESKSEKNDSGTFGVYAIRQVLALDDPDQSDADWEKSANVFAMAKQFRESLEGKTIIVEREGTHPEKEGDDSFDPDDLEEGK